MPRCSVSAPSSWPLSRFGERILRGERAAVLRRRRPAHECLTFRPFCASQTQLEQEGLANQHQQEELRRQQEQLLEQQQKLHDLQVSCAQCSQLSARLAVFACPPSFRLESFAFPHHRRCVLRAMWRVARRACRRATTGEKKGCARGRALLVYATTACSSSWPKPELRSVSRSFGRAWLDRGEALAVVVGRRPLGWASYLSARVAWSPPSRDKWFFVSLMAELCPRERRR